MNMATSLNMMVKLGAFEKMPKEGSITATDLGALINLEPSVIGEAPLLNRFPSVISLVLNTISIPRRKLICL